MATEVKEVRIAHIGIPIVCDKATPVDSPSTIKSLTLTTFIDNNVIPTKRDKAPIANITPFPGCSLAQMCGVCMPAIAGEWLKTAEKTLNTEKEIPLVEDSELLCTNGGKITLKFKAAKVVPPANKKPNIVDQAKAKINSGVNGAITKATEALQGISEGITDAVDGIKSIVENTQIASLANSLDGQLGKINDFKKATDAKVSDIDKEINELKKKIEAKITGNAYKSPEEKKKDEMQLFNAEEQKRNEQLYNQATNTALQEFATYINGQITPSTPKPSTAQSTETKKEKETKTTKETPKTNREKILSSITNAVKQTGLANNKEAQEAIKNLNNINTIIGNGIEKEISDRISTVIKNERTSLNSKIQARIDEELKELGYFDALQEYQKKSSELQQDIDKASLALKSVGNFGGFIDGVKNKYIGEAAAKYTTAVNKLSNNLKTLNTSLDGLSYVVDGMPKGEVWTTVIREIEDGDDEDGDGNKNGDGSNLSGNIFGSLDDVLNDRNEEPRILRIYAVYALDPLEGEGYRAGDIIDVDVLLPGIRVDLIIQANGKANGEVVDLNLQERSFHYDPVNNTNTNDRAGLFENITLNGASPNFDAGESYDLSDPNFAIDANGDRIEGALNDKTTIPFISRLPIEEQQEEELF